MVNLIYDSSIIDLARGMSIGFNIFTKYASIKLLHAKPPLFGSADIINVCNLHCTHCYWWLNRKNNEKDGLSSEEWRKIIRNTFKKLRIPIVTLVGGEPTLRPDLIEVFCEEMPRRVCVVTNATYPLKRFNNLYFYWVSIDGTERIHDNIRGKGTYAKTKQNILDYIDGPKNRGKPAWKDIWIAMTINSLNYHTVIDLVEEWHGIVHKIAFQFHTPFIKDDSLWLPFGDKRDKVVDNLVGLRKRFPKIVVNGEKQLSLMRGNWGGTGTRPVQCPSWAILSLDHLGRVKQPCCIGSSDTKNGLKPICERCGLGCYSVLIANGIKGNN
jgi:MoaA/NifB/PqqE/SkfB family radical SAM enzyme